MCRVGRCNLTPADETGRLQCAGFVETRPFTTNEVVIQSSRQQWSLLNRFRMERGHCGACRRKRRLVARPRRCPTLLNPVP